MIWNNDFWNFPQFVIFFFFSVIMFCQQTFCHCRCCFCTNAVPTLSTESMAATASTVQSTLQASSHHYQPSAKSTGFTMTTDDTILIPSPDNYGNLISEHIFAICHYIFCLFILWLLPTLMEHLNINIHALHFCLSWPERSDSDWCVWAAVRAADSARPRDNRLGWAR